MLASLLTNSFQQGGVDLLPWDFLERVNHNKKSAACLDRDQALSELARMYDGIRELPKVEKIVAPFRKETKGAEVVIDWEGLARREAYAEALIRKYERWRDEQDCIALFLLDY